MSGRMISKDNLAPPSTFHSDAQGLYRNYDQLGDPGQRHYHAPDTMLRVI